MMITPRGEESSGLPPGVQARGSGGGAGGASSAGATALPRVRRAAVPRALKPLAPVTGSIGSDLVQSTASPSVSSTGGSSSGSNRGVGFAAFQAAISPVEVMKRHEFPPAV